MIEDEYRRMQKERYIKATRSIELNEAVIVKTSELEKIVSDFNADLVDRISSLKEAGATQSEIFSTIQKSLMAIGLTKQESAILSKKLSK